jgi:hypothetical protein
MSKRAAVDNFASDVEANESKIGIVDGSAFSSLDKEVIQIGLVYCKGKDDAEMIWKMYIFRYVFHILNTHKIRTANNRTLIIRYVATLFSRKESYLTEKDERNHPELKAQYVAKLQELGVKHAFYAADETRNALVRDIFQFYGKLSEYRWEEIEEMNKGLTWTEIKRKTLGVPPARGKRDKPSDDCACDYCAMQLGVCLNTLKVKIDAKMKSTRNDKGKQAIIEPLYALLKESYATEWDAIDKRMEDAVNESVDEASEGSENDEREKIGDYQVRALKEEMKQKAAVAAGKKSKNNNLLSPEEANFRASSNADSESGAVVAKGGTEEHWMTTEMEEKVAAQKAAEEKAAENDMTDE